MLFIPYIILTVNHMYQQVYIRGLQTEYKF